MKKLLITIILIGLSKTYGQDTHVLYGERNLENDRHCIYFDREGFIYPSNIISNNELKNNNCSIRNWYKKNETLFLEISRNYNCDFDKVNDTNCQILNDSIAEIFTRNLNSASNTTISFFIHGFRKPFMTVNGDTDSPKDFNTLTSTFKKYNSSNSKIVEVYWDALYDCCFSANSKINEPLFQLFEQAQENAEFTGRKLKMILSRVKKDTINIITHSLGAKVAIYSTLNIDSDSSITPSNKRVNICLIAPAISPELIFKNYYSRNSQVDFKKYDNYSLFLVYNKKDFVLKKKDNKVGLFGPGPYKYGNTTLGCNYDNAATLLHSYFKENYSKSYLKLYDLSYVGKCHLVSCYCYSNNLQDTFNDMNN